MWWKTGIIYQIYPRSFKDSNGDGIGDINGIISKLDYLNDGTKNSLGIDAIWISPMYKSPMKDYGYDVSDYYDIDPNFGTMNDFDRLINEAHKRNIKVLLDFIPNHTSDQHSWFKQSRSSKVDPKRDWYIWRDPKSDGTPPNNWISVFGGPAWTLDKKTQQYYLHTFLSEQPDLNWRNQEVVKEMQNTLRFWMKRGVDGFRVDALYHLIKDDQFRDEPSNPIYRPGQDQQYDALLHIYSSGQPDLEPAINNLCRVIGKDTSRLMIGEMYLGIQELVKFYKICSNQVYLPFNFNLIALPWKAKFFKKFIDKYDRLLGNKNWPNYVFGNHDRSRLISRIGKKQARVAAMLLLTLRGTPFIYYGEELGMENTHIKKHEICDPCGKHDPLLGRDPERTPMQWNNQIYAGFSSKQPWLPVNHNFKTVNINNKSKDQTSMLNLYRRLIWYRKKSPALLHGIYQPLEIGSKDVFVYSRKKDNQQLLIILNFSSKKQSIQINIKQTQANLVFNTFLDKKAGSIIQLKNFIVRPDEGILLEL